MTKMEVSRKDSVIIPADNAYVSILRAYSFSKVKYNEQRFEVVNLREGIISSTPGVDATNMRTHTPKHYGHTKTRGSFFRFEFHFA